MYPGGRAVITVRSGCPRRSDAGFTLIELLVVLAVIGTLLGIAVPAYTQFRTRAYTRTAEANIRAALPAVEAFYADNGTYVGLGNAAKKKPPGMVAYDAGIQAKVATGKGAPTATTYCLTASSGSVTLSAKGPGAVAWYGTKTCTGTASPTPP